MVKIKEEFVELRELILQIEIECNRLGIRPTRFAEMVGVSTSSMSHVRRGISEVRYQTYKKLVEGLDGLRELRKEIEEYKQAS